MQITLARYDADYAAIRGVRFAVFVDEQSVPAEIELDERDPHCVHVLAHDAESRPVGTGRIDLDAGGKIGRVAVLAYSKLGYEVTSEPFLEAGISHVRMHREL